MAKSVSPYAISMLLANPSPDSSSDLPDIIVQVIDLKQSGNRCMFTASDGKLKLRGILPPNQSDKVQTGVKSEQTAGILLKPKEEIGVKSEGAAGILLKRKQDVVAKSAA